MIPAWKGAANHPKVLYCPVTTRTILAVVPHPDDVELSCGASICRWIRDGARAILVVATDGAFGGKLAGSDQAAIAALRREEQRRAADVIGFESVVFLGFPDGGLEDDTRLRGALVEQIRRHRPDIAVFLDPLTVIYRSSYVNHRDHRILGMSLLDAMYPQASNAGYFPEQLEQGLSPHKVPEFLLANTEQPNHWVDVSDYLDLRFTALRCHASQMSLWPDNGEAIIEQQRQYAATLGVERGVTYVEEFRRVVINPLG
jgi:LmbE family N-acetylglucosaminyl deacetylase